MTTVSRTFTVDATPDQVVGYLSDFTHAEEWDPGTESCERLDDGEVRVGSRWHNTSKIAGVSTELTYTLTDLAAGRVVFTGENDSATTTDTITVRPSGAGSEVTYEAVIEMKGAAKLADPVVKLIFEKVGSDTEKNLVERLNAL